MAQYLLLTLGGLLFGAMVYRGNQGDREPWWMLLLGMLGGGVIMAAALGLQHLLLTAAHAADPARDLSLLHALLAGVFAEVGKLAVVIVVYLAARKYFTDPMDGLIYGSIAGFGVGLVETACYQMLSPAMIELNLVQPGATSALRLLLQMMWGGCAGFALGLIVMKKPWRWTLLQSLGCVIALHAAWDFFIGFSDGQTNPQRLLAALLLGTSVVWFGGLVFKANKWSRAMHPKPKKKGIVGKILKMLITRRFK